MKEKKTQIAGPESDMKAIESFCRGMDNVALIGGVVFIVSLAVCGIHFLRKIG